MNNNEMNIEDVARAFGVTEITDATTGEKQHVNPTFKLNCVCVRGNDIKLLKPGLGYYIPCSLCAEGEEVEKHIKALRKKNIIPLKQEISMIAFNKLSPEEKLKAYGTKINIHPCGCHHGKQLDCDFNIQVFCPFCEQGDRRRFEAGDTEYYKQEHPERFQLWFNEKCEELNTPKQYRTPPVSLPNLSKLLYPGTDPRDAIKTFSLIENIENGIRTRDLYNTTLLCLDRYNFDPVVYHLLGIAILNRFSIVPYTTAIQVHTLLNNLMSKKWGSEEEYVFADYTTAEICFIHITTKLSKPVEDSVKNLIIERGHKGKQTYIISDKPSKDLDHFTSDLAPHPSVQMIVSDTNKYDKGEMPSKPVVYNDDTEDMLDDYDIEE